MFFSGRKKFSLRATSIFSHPPQNGKKTQATAVISARTSGSFMIGRHPRTADSENNSTALLVGKSLAHAVDFVFVVFPQPVDADAVLRRVDDLRQ